MAGSTESLIGGPLLLQPNVVGPFNQTHEIALELDVLADAEVPKPFLKQRIY